MSQLRGAFLAALLTAISGGLSGQASRPVTPRPVDVGRSAMTVHVYRSGLFSFAGDDHEIRAPIASGTVDEAGQTVEIAVDARKMQVLDPKLSPEKRSQVQKKMLSSELLDPDRFPDIKFRSTGVRQKDHGTLLVTGDLSLHGETRPIVVTVSGKEPHYRGSAKLKQTDFGIKPISIAGGTVKVKDEVKIDFDILTR